MTDRSHSSTLDSRKESGPRVLAITSSGAEGRRRARAYLVSMPASALLLIAVLGLLLNFTSAHAVDVPVDSVKQVIADDDGERLRMPIAVFFDPIMEETYLINGITASIIVYGPDLFPSGSIGSGRGIIAPRGVTVLPNGEVYITQVRTSKNPSPRITVLNAAFFLEREIYLDQIPETADFMPKQLAVSSGNLIYLAGENERSVLVFDEEGNFLRKLLVMDDVSLLSPFTENELPQTDEASTEAGGGPSDGEPIEVIEETGDEQATFGEKAGSGQIEVVREGEGEQTAAESIDGEPVDLTTGEDVFLTNIPEEFRPKRKREDKSIGIVDGMGPVKINAVMIDSRGRIYLLSAETGKIYVHGADEALLFSFGTAGGSPGQLSHPLSLAIDEKRELIYVVDYMRHTILAYNLEGEFIFEVGGRGVAPGWYNFPVSIATNNKGQLLIADRYNKRLQAIEVGYEDALPYLELIRAQGEDALIDADEPEETTESSLPDNVEGDGVETEPEPSIEIEQEGGNDPGVLTEQEMEPVDHSASKPSNFIIEEVIIEDAEPAGFSEDGSESANPSSASPSDASAVE